MRYFKDFLAVIIGPILGTLVIFYPFERQEGSYILPNVAFIAIPQVAWWLVCIIWWALWKPIRNRGLPYGGIAGADMLLLFMVWPWFFGRPRDEMAWLGYYYYSLPAVLSGGVICGFIEMLRRKAKRVPKLTDIKSGKPLACVKKHDTN